MQKIKWTEVAILPLMLILIIGYLYIERFGEGPRPTLEPLPVSIPEFSNYDDVEKKKQDFFGFMLPMIRKANQRVAAEREFVMAMANRHALGEAMTAQQLDRIRSLKKRYKVRARSSNAESLRQLLNRVGTIPASLILAQAANESAWGTSRFAKNGNNYFGILCFSPGCGVVPSARDRGKHHEVAKFKSIQAGVEYYLNTLNSHNAYRSLRELRAKARQERRNVEGIELAGGLVKYSERGIPYVREIQAMIRDNQLQQFDTPVQRR